MKKFKLDKKQLLSTIAAMFVLYAVMSALTYFFYMSGFFMLPWEIVRFLGVNLLLVAVFAIYLYCADIDVLKDIKQMIALDALMVFGLAVYLCIDKWLSPFAVPYAFIALTLSTLSSSSAASTAVHAAQ